MKTNNIVDFLPKKTETILVQARVNVDLVIQVKQIMNKKNLSWPDVLTACLKAFINDVNNIKKS